MDLPQDPWDETEGKWWRGGKAAPYTHRPPGQAAQREHGRPDRVAEEGPMAGDGRRAQPPWEVEAEATNGPHSGICRPHFVLATHPAQGLSGVRMLHGTP